MLIIQRPVQVKVVMTESSRAALVARYQGQIKQLKDELAQWQFQAKKLVADAQKKSPESVRLVQERIAREERLRREKLESISFLLKQSEHVPEGSELDYATVQSPVQIRIGDAWDEIMSGTEIILKDGLVYEIRQQGGKRG
jgi:hypothetical protein